MKAIKMKEEEDSILKFEKKHARIQAYTLLPLIIHHL
jgi:hypothetical protein